MLSRLIPRPAEQINTSSCSMILVSCDSALTGFLRATDKRRAPSQESNEFPKFCAMDSFDKACARHCGCLCVILGALRARAVGDVLRRSCVHTDQKASDCQIFPEIASRPPDAHRLAIFCPLRVAHAHTHNALPTPGTTP